MSQVININPNIQGGAPCFTGTRVPVVSLFDYLEGGHSIDYFLEQFPSVGSEQVRILLEESKQHALAGPSRQA